MKKFVLIFYFFIVSIVYSHPHIFFGSSFVINSKKNIVEDIDIQLILDEMTTLLYTENFSPDKKGKVLKKNIPFISDIKKHIHLSYNLEDNKIGDLVFKDAYILDESLIINFKLNINKKIKYNDKIYFSMYDKNYYYDYDYGKNELKQNEENNFFNIKFFLRENKRKSFYYGMVFPKEYEVKFIEKN